MGNYRPIKTACFVKFLLSRGCISKGMNASHAKYKCPCCFQSIIFQGAKPEVPAAHLKTCMKTLGSTLEELYSWVEENC